MKILDIDDGAKNGEMVLGWNSGSKAWELVFWAGEGWIPARYIYFPTNTPEYYYLPITHYLGV